MGRIDHCSPLPCTKLPHTELPRCLERVWNESQDLTSHQVPKSPLQFRKLKQKLPGRGSEGNQTLLEETRRRTRETAPGGGPFARLRAAPLRRGPTGGQRLATKRGRGIKKNINRDQ